MTDYSIGHQTDLIVMRLVSCYGPTLRIQSSSICCSTHRAPNVDQSIFITLGVATSTYLLVKLCFGSSIKGAEGLHGLGRA